MIARVMNPHQRRVVLALGGGGARGLAHFGAVQAVLENGLGIERIVGVSMGSMAGAMLAADENMLRVQARVLEYVASADFASRQEALFGAQPGKSKTTSGLLAWYDQIKSYLWARHLLGRVFRRRSLLAGHVLEGVIAKLVPDIDIADLPIPLSIMAVDLRSGHPIVLERGPLRRALAASAAIPGIFPPVEWESMLLCDVGVLDSLPTQVARGYGAEMVVGVDVGPRLERTEECESALHVLLRMDEIGERLMRRFSQQQADILIQPVVGHYPWFDFSKPQRLIAAGFEAGQQAIAAWRNKQPPSVLDTLPSYGPNCAALKQMLR
jgi:NTE family protein